MRKSTRAVALVVSLVLINSSAPGQNPEQYLAQVRAVQDRAETRAAFDYVTEHRDQILHEWEEITEVNAPSGQEQKRAAYVFKLLKKLKLDEVRYDSIGNLIAVRKGTGGGPRVVFDAHLDTVFQPGLDIDPKVRDGKIYAPGVGDDTRNIEALLASIRALNHARVRTKGDLVFVFTVDEERSLGGAEHFVKENKGKVDYYVALDGGHEGFTYGGIGINWYKHHFVGPGGHTRSRTPPHSATLPLARAIQRIYELEVPSDPPSNLNVGMLGAAEVVNAKAADAWFTVDLRSLSNEVMADLEGKVAQILKEEAERAGVTVRTEVISASPAARIPGHRDSPLVRIAEAVHLAMGFRNPPITETGSNNSSAALREGIASISTGAGQCGDSHALTEWCDIESFYAGTKKVILLELALAQISDN
ncbi:MAG TPA: M20/M25/M40 family metallo-hydrolase [Pyrinomonadaceae bacterium]|nr:M20/M25/M40 family metallo-hydrolase [Pyrinomonadaceae bacterium]